MRYIQTDIAGIPLAVRFNPFEEVVNNGFVISTRSQALLGALRKDEEERNSAPIDWHLFRRSKTILEDNYGAQYLCTAKTDSSVELTEIVGVPEHLLTGAITTKQVTDLLDKHFCRYAVLSNTCIALYDDNDVTNNNRVHIELNAKEHPNSISYAGRLIGGLDELEKRL